MPPRQLSYDQWPTFRARCAEVSLKLLLAMAFRIAMTEAPLTHRALDWLRVHWSIPPVAVAVIGGGSMALGVVAALWLTGWLDSIARGERSSLATRATITMYLLLGYVPVAQYYLRTWTVEHLKTIEQRFGVTANRAIPPRRSFTAAGVLGSVTFYFSFFHRFDAPLWTLDPRNWTVDLAVPLLGGFVIGWFNFRFMFELCWYALAVSRTAARIRQLDLLDTPSVFPYAQHGVRSSLLVLVLLSISANLWLDPDSPVMGTMLTLGMFIAAAVVVLVLPTGHIHAKLKRLKESELADVRREIRRRRRLAERSADDAQQLRADLAVEHRLMQASVWPMDAGSYGRVLLYLGLGLGSWIGAALVERLLEQTI